MLNRAAINGTSEWEILNVESSRNYETAQEAYGRFFKRLRSYQIFVKFPNEPAGLIKRETRAMDQFSLGDLK